MRAEEVVQEILDRSNPEQAQKLFSQLIHGLWTKAVGTDTYVKEEWTALDMLLGRLLRKWNTSE